MAFGMKETVNSLRAYFVLIGMLVLLRYALLFETIYVRGGDFSLIFRNPGLMIGFILGLALAVAYLYIGFGLRTLLVTGPSVVRGVIVTSMVLVVLAFLLSLLVKFEPFRFGELLVELLITWYLLHNVNRLVREQKGE